MLFWVATQVLRACKVSTTPPKSKIIVTKVAPRSFLQLVRSSPPHVKGQQILKIVAPNSPLTGAFPPPQKAECSAPISAMQHKCGRSTPLSLRQLGFTASAFYYVYVNLLTTSQPVTITWS